MIKALLFFVADGLICYIFGYIVGRCTAEQELNERRSELGLDDEPEDEWGKLFKE